MVVLMLCGEEVEVVVVEEKKREEGGQRGKQNLCGPSAWQAAELARSRLMAVYKEGTMWVSASARFKVRKVRCIFLRLLHVDDRMSHARHGGGTRACSHTVVELWRRQQSMDLCRGGLLLRCGLLMASEEDRTGKARFTSIGPRRGSTMLSWSHWITTWFRSRVAVGV